MLNTIQQNMIFYIYTLKDVPQSKLKVGYIWLKKLINTKINCCNCLHMFIASFKLKESAETTILKNF